MRNDSIRKSTFRWAIACAAAFGFATALAADTKPEKTAIPPTSHVTIATPGSQWLNVSRPLTPEDLRDQVVLLDFWTYCCINCLHTIPELAKLEKEFKDQLVVIGVHSAKFDTEKDTDQIRQAVLRYGIDHPVVNDRDFRIWRMFDVRAWPTLVLLKPNGEVARVASGEGHTAEMRKAIRAVLKAFPKRPKPNLPIELERDKIAKGEFFYPSKLAFDRETKTLFVADSSHDQIAAYTWNPKEPAALKPAFRVGKSATPGFANGTYASARFRRPQGLLFSKGALYVADTENHAIRKIDLKSKTVSTIAGTGKQGEVPKRNKNLPARSTALSSPWDLALHPDADHLVIAMAGDHQLWSLDLKSHRLSVIAGTGAEAIDDGLVAENTLAQPSGLSSLLGSLYFVDAESSSLRFYFEGYVRTLVGSGLFDFGFKDGDRKRAKLQHPLGIFADVTGVYVADTFNHSIRRYDPQKQTLETVIGDGHPGEGAADAPTAGSKVELNEPSGITKLAEGLFAISDTNNHRLVVWNKATGKVERMKIDGEKFAETKLDAKSLRSGTAVAARKRISLHLPNTLAIPDAKVNRTNPVLHIILPEHYKLNEEGPSFARLFEGAPPKESLKRAWKREDLVKSTTLSLSDLKEGADYTFQGTFYFCLTAKNAVCEIASVSFPLHVDPHGTEKIDVNLTGALVKAATK
jgi:thiol-disulfide isomerase/thioredoxin